MDRVCGHRHTSPAMKVRQRSVRQAKPGRAAEPSRCNPCQATIPPMQWKAAGRLPAPPVVAVNRLALQ
ncbi:hypothetical protein D187_007335 [Cystobacter fuscus DSM 2262]|uniref:Uncharacterized protein n=1 Tax=Cystobacter fuscus (strain ATCC 25194 / DSM 2262 / NBRC 100088 / M29) TaxID=1242864 RepID=S9Q6D9_CYSF2|nr:hypothetical protein D187_007335 [Cystobacter fuscus DSM 2262]